MSQGGYSLERRKKLNMNKTPIDYCKNPSSNSVTVENWVSDSSGITHSQVTSAVMLLIIVVGLPWNVLIVITAVKKSLYHQPTIMLLLNLVMVDILLLIIHLPVVVVVGIAGEFIIGSTDMMRCQICKITLFVAVTLFLDSIFIIALMSIDRFLFIYKPLHYEGKATKRRTLVSIALVAMLSIAISSFVLISPDASLFYPKPLYCLFNAKSEIYIVSVVIVCCMALGVITVCNIWVIYIVQKNIRAVYDIRKSLSNTDKRNSHIQDLNRRVRETRHKKQLHLFRVFGALLLSNAIAWIPKVLLYIVGEIFPEKEIPIAYSSTVEIIFLSQVAIHPILESTLISDLREPMKDMVTCGLKKKDNFATTEEHTHSCLHCCTSTEGDDDKDCSCSLMFKLIDVAVLPPTSNSSSHGI